MNPRFRLLALVLTLVASSVATAANLPQHPRLLLDSADLATLKQKIQGPFAPQWAQWLKQADALLATPVDLPPRGGNWSHNYVCPEHGARLHRGKQLAKWQWQHICPVGNHILLGDPSKGTTDFDGNAIMQAHDENAQACVTLGVAFQVTGDARYVNRAKEILLAYAARYRDYPLHDNQGRLNTKGGAHVASQSLSEASWLIPIAQGADLIWDTLKQDDRTSIADKLLRPALDDVILPHNLGIHNIQCWHNSAIGSVGLLLADDQLIAKAIDDPKSGFRQQIAQGVRDDGMWCEGSSGYHFYTLSGLQPLAQAARHCGIDLYSDRYKSMFDAPLKLAMPDLRLPNFNDSGFVDLARSADTYEPAYARWKDPAYLPLLASGKRTGRLALLYGVPTLPASNTPPPAEADLSFSHNSPASGYAILRSDATANATWLCTKYGPHGGGHGHPDKNTFILYANHQIIAADAGTHAYGSPLHAVWDKTTLAHNTLVVDETSQAQSTGKCLAFGSESGVSYAMTDAGPIYPDKGVKFVRTLAMIDAHTILGIDRVTTDGKPRTLDIAFHLPGDWSTKLSGEPWTAKPKTPYAVLAPTLTRSIAATEPITLTVKNHDHQVHLTLLAGEPTQLITGAGVGESTDDRVPTAIFRRTANQTTYIWTITLDKPAPELATVPSAHNSTILAINRALQLTSNPTDATVTVKKTSNY